jgi:hypothetical protein
LKKNDYGFQRTKERVQFCLGASLRKYRTHEDIAPARLFSVIQIFSTGRQCRIQDKSHGRISTDLTKVSERSQSGHKKTEVKYFQDINALSVI